MIDYGEALKYQREINGYSQNKLAKETGIAQPKISYYETGQHAPPIDFCIQLAQFYGCSLDELVGLSDYDPQNKLAISEQTNNAVSAFDSEFGDILNDNNFIQTAKLYKAISPELRALALGYIVGLLQSNNVNTRTILGY